MKSVPKNTQLSKDLFHNRVPHSPPWIPLRECPGSAAAAVQADGKCPCCCCLVTGNALGKCQFVVDNSNLFQYCAKTALCHKKVRFILNLKACLNIIQVNKIFDQQIKDKLFDIEVSIDSENTPYDKRPSSLKTNNKKLTSSLQTRDQNDSSPKKDRMFI